LEILELIGQGGMGAVYKARQPALDRLVAVKVLPPEAARDPAFAGRFSQEARSLARLNHPNILTIYDFGEAGGLYSITMEFLAGKTLRQLLQAGPLAEAEALRIVIQVCDALQYAHDEGVVHRDIKPENILLDGRGRVKIADFGLAKIVGRAPAYGSLTGSRDVMGTVYYIAPEQLLGAHHVDHRADLYSLGVVFYEMLTGELPVGRFAPPAQRARVDARLDGIVLRALAREPEHRYQDAADIQREVEAVLAGRPSHPVAVPAAHRTAWPCVRFTIPEVSWAGAWAEGEIFRDEMTLIVEFSLISSVGTRKHGEVRIPLAEILTISCYAGGRARLPSWVPGRGKCEIALKVYDPAVLAGLPVGKHGRGRLQVHRHDTEAAQQLVAGILGTPLPRPAGRTPFPELAGHAADPRRIRTRLLGPAVGLLLTAVAAFVSTLVLAVNFALQVAPHFADADLVATVAALLGAGAAGLMLAGALQMMRRRAFLLCVTAALLAVVPWSPAWLLGLPAGIWALVVLSQPEVILAFLGVRRGAPPISADPPKRPGPVAAKMWSFLRSVGGYVLMTFPGRASRQPANDVGRKN
jgi:tRNA A-37 threonylcarbamoyl transferase component Bud32